MVLYELAYVTLFIAVEWMLFYRFNMKL